MGDKPLILLVDGNRRNLELLSDSLGRDGYDTISAASLDEVDQAFESIEGIALALVDVTSFSPAIWERCDQLREEAVPFLILSTVSQSTILQQKSIVHGSMGVLTKPLASRALLDLIGSVLES